MLRRSALFSVVCATFLFGAAAQASGIAEVEPNDSVSAAQVVSGASYSLDADASIINSTTVPHATIRAGSSSTATFDYYRITVTAPGVQGIFDIDASSQDLELFLYTSAGALIAANDDSVVDPGPNGLNPLILVTFQTAGEYIIGVCQFNCFGGSGNTPMTGNSNVQEYLLHISLDQAVQVPEPCALLLSGAGLLVMGGVRRRRAIAARAAR